MRLQKAIATSYIVAVPKKDTKHVFTVVCMFHCSEHARETDGSLTTYIV